MKKKRIEHHTFDMNEDSEQGYQRKLKVDQRILQTFLYSFYQCFCVPFYPCDFTVFPQTDSFVNQLEENENKNV